MVEGEIISPSSSSNLLFSLSTTSMGGVRLPVGAEGGWLMVLVENSLLYVSRDL